MLLGDLMKKAKYILLILLVIVLVGISMHHTTIRSVDKYGASIAPDQSIRLIKVPIKLTDHHGYHLKKLSYSKDQHKIIATYQPAKSALSQIKRSKYVGVTFQPTTVPIVNRQQTDPFILNRKYQGSNSARDTLRILAGNSYNNLTEVAANYPAVNVRDPSIVRINNRYYIIYTRGLMYTSDFEHWHQISWPKIRGYQFAQDWGPEFVKGPTSKYYVIMSACADNESKHRLIITSFSKNGEIGTHWFPISGNLPNNCIDPSMQYVNNKYYLVCKNEASKTIYYGNSNSLYGPFKMRKLDIKGKNDHLYIEGPEILLDRHKEYVMFDTYNIDSSGLGNFHGLHYVERGKDTRAWSYVKKINSSSVLRHGQIIMNRN